MSFPVICKIKLHSSNVTDIRTEVKHGTAADGVCQILSKLFENFMSSKFVEVSASSTKNQNGNKGHVTNQLFRLKLKRASDVDSAYQIPCKSIFNFMRKRFLKDLASFSKYQNGGQTT